MNIFQGLLYGIISGISQFLPVPSTANQAVLLKLFGLSHRDHLCDAVVHIGILAALIISARGLLEQVRYESHRRPSRHMNNSYIAAERRFTRNASTYTILLLILFIWMTKLDINYLLTSGFLLINGLVLFVPSRMYQGNKDARLMSVFDSFLAAVANALFVIPGFSAVGCLSSAVLARGADRQRIVNWILILSLPTLVVLTCADIVFLISNWNLIVFGNLFAYIFAGAAAYLGGYFGVVLLRMIAKRPSTSVSVNAAEGSSRISNSAP